MEYLIERQIMKKVTDLKSRFDRHLFLNEISQREEKDVVISDDLLQTLSAWSSLYQEVNLMLLHQPNG